MPCFFLPDKRNKNNFKYAEPECPEINPQQWAVNNGLLIFHSLKWGLNLQSVAFTVTHLCLYTGLVFFWLNAWFFLFTLFNIYLVSYMPILIKNHINA